MRPTREESSFNFFLKSTSIKGVWNLPYTFLFTLIIVLLWTGAQYLGMYLGINFNPDYVDCLQDFYEGNSVELKYLGYQGDILWPAALISAIIGSIAVFIFAIIKKEKSVKDYLSLKFPKISQLFLWMVVLFGFVFLSEYLLGSNPEMQSDFVDQVMTSTKYPFMFILSVGIAVPIFEELLFRGFLFVGIEKASNHHIAVWVTAFIFAIIHVQYSVAIMAMIVVMALILGYSRVHTKSIWTPIILHMVNNIMTSLIGIFENTPV